jgi:hypothetical protein
MANEIPKEKELVSKSLSEKLCLIYWVANITIALTWIYHGIVPKLLYMETGELPMVKASGMFEGNEAAVVYAVGVAEIIFGMMFLFLGRLKIMHWLNIGSLVALGIAACTIKSDIFIYPFNPATTAFGVIGLSIVVLAIREFVPRAGKLKQ